MTGMAPEIASSDVAAPGWRASSGNVVLAPGEIHVFAFAVDLPPSRTRGLERLLSDDEHARADRFRRPEDRLHFVVGRARMRAILGRYVTREAARLQFCYGAHGKPALRGEDGGDRIRFNMSRSPGLGLLALQLDEDLGIDIERIRPFPDALAVARRLFAAEEYEALEALPGEECDATFFRYWTRKEAVVKSIGLGLSYPVNAFTLSRDPGESAERLVIAGENGTSPRWSLPVPEPCPGYVAALVTAGSPRPVRCWTWAEQ